MAVIKIKIPKKITTNPEKELSLTDIRNQRIEKERNLAQDIKDKELAELEEKKRMHKILVPYLDDLQDTLEEKGLLSFWIFPDRPGFEKIRKLSFGQMEKITRSDLDKYKGRYIAHIRISFFHHDSPKSLFRKSNIYMATDFAVHIIDKNGMIGNIHTSWGAAIAWRAEDFITTKFSLKLIQILYRQVVNKLYQNATVLGHPLTRIVNTLIEKGVDFQNSLSPLAKLLK